MVLFEIWSLGHSPFSHLSIEDVGCISIHMRSHDILDLESQKHLIIMNINSVLKCWHNKTK